jgi:hypothetical protein
LQVSKGVDKKKTWDMQKFSENDSPSNIGQLFFSDQKTKVSQ